MNDADTPPRPHADRAAGVAGVVRHVGVGFAMGAADLVPGVSGGTIAFVGGIYERLLAAIGVAVDSVVSFVRGRPAEAGRHFRNFDWWLLVPLAVGLGAALVTLSSLIEHLLDSQPERMAGLFMGLVAGSVILSYRLLKVPGGRLWAVIAASSVVTFVLLGLQKSTSTPGTEDAVVTAPLWVFPLAGAVAICAMILPGISGSFLLVMMGMYRQVLGAVNDRNLTVIVVFAVGCAVGLGAFSRLLRWLLDRHHDLVVAALIGLMVGSTRILWPWPNGTASTVLELPSGEVVWPVLLSLVGFAGVMVLGLTGQIGAEVAHDEDAHIPHDDTGVR